VEVIILFIWLGSAILAALAAPSRGRSSGGWFVLGLLFGIFALIALLVMPSVGAGVDEPTPSTHLRCPDCRELVRKDARVCKHCGCKLIPQ
jgi:hypothetical protein